jgi:hypothetical protein
MRSRCKIRKTRQFPHGGDLIAAATKPFHNRIALVFKFDDTLAPDSFNALVESIGVEPEEFWEGQVQPLIDASWEQNGE